MTALISPPLSMSSSSSSYSATNNNINSSSSQRIDTEKLRIELDQLHAEAELTRSKASNARLRLMRLSEAAENLQKRAANSILVGKETEARELLVQKKRVMQALEKSKNRIDVLDKLAVKINEAISLKEVQLIGNVAMYPEFTQEESDCQIRFVKPKEYGDGVSKGPDDLKKDSIKTDEDDEQDIENREEGFLWDCEELSFKEASSFDLPIHDNLSSNLNGITSYKEFLEYIDEKLQQVESDLLVFLRVSNLILETEQKQISTKMQQTSGLLKDIRDIRERIVSIIRAQTV